MAFMKHVGKHGDRRVCVLFRQVPGEDHMALIIYPDTIHAHWQDAIQKVLESDLCQQGDEFADALHRNYFPDGRPMLETLHQERMIKKLRTADIIVTPTPSASIRLDELNKMLNEMKQGEEAVKKMAENDAARGLVDPTVKRSAEAEFKSRQAGQVPPVQTNSDGALDDRALAANMLAQAQRMEAEGKGLLAEAARMKKDAERMSPNVVAAPSVTTADKPKRGRPAKSKVADAAQ